MANPVTQTRHGDAQKNDSHDMETQNGGNRLGLYRLTKSGRNVIVYDDIKHPDNVLHRVDVGFTLREAKTVGMLMPTAQDRPNNKAFNFEQAKYLNVRGPTLFATSGWSYNPESHPQVVDSTKWAWIALKVIAPCIRHDFNRSQDDNGAQPALPEFDGRRAASHVEVLLSTAYAFFVTQAFVPRVEGEPEESFLRKQLQGLSRVRDMVPKGRRDVALYLDKDPCGRCRDYVHKMEQLTGLRIRLVATCVKATQKRKKPDPEFSMQEARRQIENMSSKDHTSMAGYRHWNKAKRKTKSSKNTKPKWQLVASTLKDFGLESDDSLCQDFSDSHFEVAIRDDADLMASTYDDFGSESTATLSKVDWDSDSTMHEESDDDTDAIAPRTPHNIPYRNPFPEPVYHSPTEGHFC